MKKVVILCIILAIIVIALVCFIIQKTSNSKENEASKSLPTSTTFYDSEHSISIELSNAFNLTQHNSNLGYLMELRSENNLNIFVSKETMISNQKLSDVIEADKSIFLLNFDSYSNLSDTKELSVNNNLAYTYSFHYLDKTLNEAYYLQVVWLQVENTVYIFDIEFPLDDLAFNTNLALSVLSSFKINP